MYKFKKFVEIQTETYVKKYILILKDKHQEELPESKN